MNICIRDPIGVIVPVIKLLYKNLKCSFKIKFTVSIGK